MFDKAFRTVMMLSVIVLPVAQGRELSFDERVEAQHAIERVRWNHRIWPESNPGPRPPLESVVPEQRLRAKVDRYLRQSLDSRVVNRRLAFSSVAISKEESS